MFSRFKCLFTVLALFAFLSATTIQAIVTRLVVLKKDNNGKPHYIHCFSDAHCETFWHHIAEDEKTVQLRALQLAFNKRLHELALSQGRQLIDFAQQCGAGKVVMINENILEYEGSNVEMKKIYEKITADSNKQPAGERGFLQYMTELFRKQQLPIVNAECSQAQCLGGYSRDTFVKKEYLSTLDEVIAEIDKSTIPAFLKKLSRERVEDARKYFNTITNYALLARLRDTQKQFAGLLDARIPHLIWSQAKKEHIFLLLGGQHIVGLIPNLLEAGYTKIIDKGEETDGQIDPYLNQGRYNGLSHTFLDSVALDLKMVLTDACNQLGLSDNAARNDEKLDEVGTIPMSPNSSVPVAITLQDCGNCGVSKPNMSQCSACKAVHYCSRECQKKNWALHKKVCKKK